MSFTNVKLILLREIRDQLRDRRTLFMMFVLPLLLYPLLGMSFLQMQHFLQEQPTSVLVVGAKNLKDLPRLFDNGQFAPELFNSPDGTKLLEVTFQADEPPVDAAAQRENARLAVDAGLYDAAICFPESFAADVELFQHSLRTSSGEVGTAIGAKNHALIPEPETFYTNAKDTSSEAERRLNEVWRRWNDRLIETNLVAAGLPVAVARPVPLKQTDLAKGTPYHGASLWSRILPVLLLIWALTGAFYPAVDLCAGEKERGTLETLLCSPAERSEIVLGKLATVMLFSMLTAVLNLASVGSTGWLVFGGRPEFGPPPLTAVLWLAVALVPVSALFSALCLALAAFAKSSKEGQYYLMPLLLITMPLAVLPMMPGVQLNLGSSLIPVTGVVILLRSVLEGNYLTAMQFLPVVAAVTLAACLLAIRWAVDQFNSESVLFRESEQLDMRLWLRRLSRDRKPTPTVGAAVFCGVTILLLRFFGGNAMGMPEDFAGFAATTLATQLLLLVLPALLMTMWLTSSPGQTLLLRRPPLLAVGAAALLAVVLHPVVVALSALVVHLYPISADLGASLERTQGWLDAAPLWQIILLVAVTPAICEELVFRGFILSGLRHLGHKWRAIIYSAVFFGVAHMVLQQSLMAALTGTVIGYVAVQSGSLLPGVVYHMVHNSLAISIDRIPQSYLESWPVLRWVKVGDGYPWQMVVASAFWGLAILLWFGTLTHSKTSEEELQEAIRQAEYEDEERQLVASQS